MSVKAIDSSTVYEVFPKEYAPSGRQQLETAAYIPGHTSPPKMRMRESRYPVWRWTSGGIGDPGVRETS